MTKDSFTTKCSMCFGEKGDLEADIFMEIAGTRKSRELLTKQSYGVPGIMDLCWLSLHSDMMRVSLLSA